MSKESFWKSARPRRLASPGALLTGSLRGIAGLGRRPRSYLSARARRPALKSRGHSRSSLGPSGSSEPADELASRRQQVARTPRWPAGGGSPPSRLRRLSPPPLRGGGGARQPRLALAQVQQPVRAKRSARPPLSAASFSLPPPRQLPLQRKALQKFAPGPGGHLSPVLLAGKLLAAAAALRTSPGGQWPLSTLSAALAQLGSLRLGAAGEGALPALPRTPAWEPQALAPGRWRENGKENKICSPSQLTVPVCLPASAYLHSRLAASATLSATLSPYPARAQHLSATSQPLKIAHDVTPRPSHWLASLSGGRAHPSPWRPHPRRFFSGPAEAHGMR